MLKQHKHKSFNYQSSFSKEKDSDANLEDSKKIEFVSKWKRNSERSRKVKGAMPIRTLIIVLVLLLICMYLLENKYM
ncbi:hypothetical protein QLS71_003235 [Mariniflexile litorale]|uniref:Uncharacterized protein n=1 Tax=Mariniflexile litorale TaxID=3045158 RepID=A0AAU7EJ42_9FLAO|nr:hypothetical protein [Mariniflexile sp. KMM 9835]MDQ8210030.1 hypothetical protein [Mariniflexile sp. KMM 9835]